jgi:dihydrofolate synthase / folylpolyglutamate synthase
MVRMPHWPIPQLLFPTRNDLSVMANLMDKLGNPHLKIPPVIHVAGTNGKGSSVAYLKSSLEAAGYKVHAYTSPHLLEYNERIILAGDQILDDYLFYLLERTRAVAEKHNIQNTFFEGSTAAAFLGFSEIDADIVILETGLGGRLDATNIVPNPILTIITPISYDHMEYLGPTLPIIAGEKAGIVKRGVPCVISAQIPEVMEIFLAKCEELESPSCAYGYDFVIGVCEKKNFTLMQYGSPDIVFDVPALLGDHQILNAGTVIAALEFLRPRFNIDYNHIISGLKKVKWPGRLQKIKYRGQDIWLDAAHNLGGAQVLALWVKENLDKPVSLILGMTKNRDALAFSRYFVDVVDKIFCVKVLSEPSSYSAERLMAIVSPHGIYTEYCESLDEAIVCAKKYGNSVIIAGSTFLVADALKL